MLRGSTVVELANAIVPLYLCMVLGYVSSKLRVLPHEQTYAGIAGFINKFSLPFLLFRMISTNDPYNMHLKLLAADTVYRIAVLFVLCLACLYRPTHQSLAWVSSLFNLATMPNSLLISPRLLTSLYPGTAKDVTALLFMQFSLWSCVCILILEIHKAVYENSKEFEAKENIVTDACRGTSFKSSDLEQSEPKKQQPPPGIADNPVIIIHVPQFALKEFEGPQTDFPVEKKVRPTKRQAAEKIAQTVFLKFFFSPIVWGSMLGFSFSLLNFRFNQGKALPAILNSWIDLIANGTLGICMFMLGMDIGVAPKLFACGIAKTVLGVVMRFTVAPACMGVVSYAVGLRDDMFRFAVMQAMVPQAIVSFVWASQYNVHADIFTTALWFQTAIFVPFAIAMNMILNLGS